MGGSEARWPRSDNRNLWPRRFLLTDPLKHIPQGVKLIWTGAVTLWCSADYSLEEINDLDRPLGVRFRVESLCHESLQRTDGHSLVDGTTTTRRFARSTAHASTNTCEWIRATGDKVRSLKVAFSDCAHVPPRVGMHRASVLAFDLPLPVLVVGNLDVDWGIVLTRHCAFSVLSVFIFGSSLALLAYPQACA